jgi:hypothetical protein
MTKQPLQFRMQTSMCQVLWIGVGAMALLERPGNPLRTEVCLGSFIRACFESRYSAVIRPGAPARASEDDVLEVGPRVRDHKWMASDATSTWSHLDSNQRIPIGPQSSQNLSSPICTANKRRTFSETWQDGIPRCAVCLSAVGSRIETNVCAKCADVENLLNVGGS